MIANVTFASIIKESKNKFALRVQEYGINFQIFIQEFMDKLCTLFFLIFPFALFRIVLMDFKCFKHYKEKVKVI